MNIPDERLGLPSASSIERLSLCPGSARMCQGVSRVVTPQMKAWGESGDRIHLWLEAPDIITLDPDELDVAERCLEQRNELMAQVFPDADTDPVETIKEKRLWLYHGKRKILSGKMDFGAVRGDIAFVIDYKTSYGDTAESADNMQLRTNLVLLHEAIRRIHPIMEAYVAIIQPLTGRSDLCRYSLPTLDMARDQIFDVVKNSQKKDAPIVPGAKQCRNCPALLKCPQATHLVDELNVDLGGISSAALSALLDKWEVVKVIGANAVALAKERDRETPGSVPNWRLGEPGSQRVITSVGDVFKALKEQGLMDEATFIAECVKCGLGDTEAALVKRNKMKKAEAKKAFNNYCGDYITMKPKEASLERIKP